MTGIIPPEELADETPRVVAGDETAVPGTDAAGSDLAAVRELVLRAHPDAAPELVSGATVDELLASIEPARTAYARIAERIAPATTIPSVPAGGAGPVPLDPDRLPAPEKIRRGLASR